MRCLYVKGNLQPHHHMAITHEHRMDLLVWKKFLEFPNIFCRSFLKIRTLTAEDVCLYSDASRNFELAFGAYCGSEWTWGQWNLQFMQENEPSIEFLELFGVAVGVLNWIKFFANKKIALFCDNIAVVHMINNMTSGCKQCMALLRLIVF